MRLIDADALLDKLLSESWYDNADLDEVAYPLVDGQPTVEAEPVVHAHWEWKQFPTGSGRFELKATCSACHKANKQYEPPYCPHCGAKMDEPDE